MEVWDLFDENRQPLGKQAGRRDPMVKGEFHIVVVACVVNDRNEILLTLRSPKKEKYPGTWENTGGALEAGEESRAAAVRELFEETGIRVKENELHLLDSQSMHLLISTLSERMFLLRRSVFSKGKP